MSTARTRINDLVREGRFRPTQPYQRFAYRCGALLFASALFHLVVYAVDGGAWEGPVSWRKPILFSFSFGITVVSLAWFLTFFKMRNASGWVTTGVLGVASLVEVFLISMQKWRNVESHFNDSTTFDSNVFGWMGLMVLLVALVATYITIRSWMKIDAPPGLAWAIRLGLLLLVVSQGVGVTMITEGTSTFGGDGALKVPHAVTLHAAQVLAALALLLQVTETTDTRRVRLVLAAALGYAGIVAATMIQTYSGRSTFDFEIVSVSVALGGLALLGVIGVIALQGLLRRAAVQH